MMRLSCPRHGGAAVCVSEAAPSLCKSAHTKRKPLKVLSFVLTKTSDEIN